MPIPRIYLPHPLAADSTTRLDERARRHAVQVLRLKPGDPLVVFNGEGGEYRAVIESNDRRSTRIMVGEHRDIDRESPLDITLYQGISRGERMDYTIQKAVELGISRIVPLLSERTQVKLNAERRDKRLRHWQGIITHACEQSGRNRLPELAPVMGFAEALAEHDSRHRQGLLLQHDAERGLDDCDAHRPFSLLIGPEGGLSEPERRAALTTGFQGTRLGPRVLRTETAALAALAAMQQRWGDMG